MSDPSSSSPAVPSPALPAPSPSPPSPSLPSPSPPSPSPPSPSPPSPSIPLSPPPPSIPLSPPPSSPPLSPSLSPPASTLPGVAEIGTGYNVLTGLYADPISCSRSLFDFSKSGSTNYDRAGKSYSYPSVLTMHTAAATTYNTSFGQTINDYTSALNSKTKLEGGAVTFFSGSLSVDFDSKSVTNNSYAFTRTQQTLSLFSLLLPTTTALKDLLIPSAKTDIATAPPEKLFLDYGTHFTNKIVVGGRAVYSSSTSKLSFQSSFSVEVIANVSYKSLVGGLSADEKTKYAKDIGNFTASSTTTIKTRGGDTRYAGENLLSHWNDWVVSVADNPVFVDFVDNTSLVPIWELAPDEARETELKQAYLGFIAKYGYHLKVNNGPYLYAMEVPLDITLSTDKGSHATEDISTFRPVLGSDWFYLAPVAFPHYNNPTGTVIVVKEIVAGSLQAVKSWQPVWNDKGSRRIHDYSLWKGFADNPQEYRVLGDFFRGPAHNQDAPSGDEVGPIRAVFHSMLTPAKVGTCVWNDAGTGASKDGSVWNIIAESAVNSTETRGFVANNSHDAPNDRQLFVLKSDALVWLHAGEKPTSSLTIKTE